MVHTRKRVRCGRSWRRAPVLSARKPLNELHNAPRSSAVEQVELFNRFIRALGEACAQSGVASERAECLFKLFLRIRSEKASCLCISREVIADHGLFSGLAAIHNGRLTELERFENRR